MSSHHVATEIASGETDSLASTPRSFHHTNNDDTDTARIRLMCSFNGKILPRPHDNQLRYVGGDTRIVAVHRHGTYPYLLAKLSKLCGTSSIGIKYQLPNEDLDALITVATDEDVENMMEEYDRLVLAQKSARLRLFIFTDDADSRSSSISSLLDGSVKREHWFLDALNRSREPGNLERVQSEASSIVSDMPDYLFGLDITDDASRDTKVRQKNAMLENILGSDPGSPAPVASSPFHSTSSTLAPPVAVPAIPDLPPVKTKPCNPTPVIEPGKESPVTGVNDGGGDEHKNFFQLQSGNPNNPNFQYSAPPMQQVPMYYMQSPGGQRHLPVHMGGGYVQSYPGQVPPGYMHPVSNLGQMYAGGGRPIAIDPATGRVITDYGNPATGRVITDYGNPATGRVITGYGNPATGRVITDYGNQQVAYGVRNTAGMMTGYPGMVVPGGEERQGPGN